MTLSYLEAMELRDEENGAYGDPRRCPRHPNVTTSSNDGMFDAPCGVCEGEMEEAYGRRERPVETPEERAARWAEEERRSAEYAEWLLDQEAQWERGEENDGEDNDGEDLF